MDFTNPFISAERRRLSDSELAQAIRLDMAAELDAINLYQAHLESTDNPVAQRVIRHIMDEEKEHFVEFEQLLLLLDLTQATIEGNAAQEFAEASGGSAEAAPPAPTNTLPAPCGLTVGSLKE